MNGYNMDLMMVIQWRYHGIQWGDNGIMSKYKVVPQL